MSTEQLDSLEKDFLNEIDLDNMVSEVKQQTYHQERLKFNFQIILKELRFQRGTIQGLKYLEQENKNLKQNVSESNQALKRLIEQVKSQTEYLKTQTDQIMVEQIEGKEKQEESDRRINQQQLQLQTLIEKQRSNERVHDSLTHTQNEITLSLQTTQDELQQISGKTDHNTSEISQLKTAVTDIKCNVNEVKNTQERVALEIKSMEKRVHLQEENYGKLQDKIEGSNRKIESHSGQIKELYELIKKNQEENKLQDKQIQENERKISSLQTSFSLKNSENDKEFSLVNSEIEKLKNQLKQILQSIGDMKPLPQEPQRLYDDDLDKLKKLINSLKSQFDNLNGQVYSMKGQIDSITGSIGSIQGDTNNLAQEIASLKKQLAKFGNFINRDQLEKAIKEMKDFQVSWNGKIEIFVNREIEELKKLLSQLPKGGVTEEQVQIYILEVLQKAADKQETKKALLYLENLVHGLHSQQPEKIQGPAPPFTCQQLLWSQPRCAACLDSGEPGKCPTGCQHGFEKTQKLNQMICCQQSLKIQCEKNLPKLFSTSKFVLRPATAKSQFNTQPKSFNLLSTSQNNANNNNLITDKNLSVILNLDLDILKGNQQGETKKSYKQYQDKKFVKNSEEIAKIQNLQEKTLKNYRLRNMQNNNNNNNES